MIFIVNFENVILKSVIVFVILISVIVYLDNGVTFHGILPVYFWKFGRTKMVGDRMKYILIWSDPDKQWDFLNKKQDAFLENNCEYTNCYVTIDRNLIKNDYKNFDAILMNEKSFDVFNTLPSRKDSDQIYIFGTRASADNQPICNRVFDYYFNITWTYRLDSDVIWPYFDIYDKDSRIIGPRKYMHWVQNIVTPIHDSLKELLLSKVFSIVWFMRDCEIHIRRHSLVNELEYRLKRHRLLIDVYDLCKDNKLLETDKPYERILQKYHFYVVIESSISEDYVTDKLLMALKHFTVPIVFGGVDYTRFLPPHSYIDAQQLGPGKTASTIAYLLKNRTAYLEYFQWHNSYSYKSTNNSICRLCEEINRGDKKLHQNFREWWNPYYANVCNIRENNVDFKDFD